MTTEAELRADMQREDMNVLRALVRAILARLEARGLTTAGWLTSKLVGALYVYGTPMLVVDDVSAGSTGLPVPMSQAHTFMVVNGWLRTPPSGSPFSIGVYRHRGAARTLIATVTFGVGARRAQGAVMDTAGLADDLYEPEVLAADSGGAALDPVLWPSPRIDVIRGAG